MEADRGKAIGISARARVLSDYDWSKNLRPFDALLNAADALQAGTE
jgi:hypothetical protein